MSSGPERLLFTNARVFTADDEWPVGWLMTEGRRIRLLGPGRPPAFAADDVTRRIDCGGGSLLPGFIDLHVHGAVGYEATRCGPEGLQAMARFFARHGVTGFLPSVWTAPREVIAAALGVIGATLGPVDGGATILGAHLEGPYLNPAKAGAQDPRYIRRAARDEALAFLASGIVRLIAIAPEYPENRWLIEECVRRGIRVSAAHTTATYAQMLDAVAAGVRQATHTYNAMLGLGHREPGTVGAIMTLPELDAELIADNVHVHPAAMRALVRAKGAARVILVTDALGVTGLEANAFQLDDRTIAVRDGAARLPDGTLAGSVLTLDRALGNIMAAAGLPLREAWPLSSLHAARAIGLAATKGSLEVGKDADLALLDADFQVQLTVAEGRIVHEAAMGGSASAL
jgi:N-acetylglucosamine-6-phosphate deacetylase